MTPLQQQGAAAKAATYVLATAGTAKKNAALAAIADILTNRQDEWLSANAQDVAAAKKAGMRPAMLDRLTLTPERVGGIVDGVRQVMALPDPIGQVTKMETRPNGLIIGRRRVPLGVIAIIFEARPNVTVDAAALCLKAGNVCILRGGKEAIRSNRCVAKLMREALVSVELPEDCISLVQDTSHETANELMHLDGYVDDEADLDMAAKVLFNAKCSRPSVCNAVECVLVQEDIAKGFWEKALPLLDEKGVELRADAAALDILGARALPAAESDWDAEYDDYILAVKTVKDMDEAIGFINQHGTGHSESIITKNYFKAQHFLDRVDAAAVYVNASTRFTDGGEFGLGAEIGISTQKMHARGPMGLEELTSCKYVIYGEGQVR